MRPKVPEPSLERLILYQRLLRRLKAQGVKVISSEEMGQLLGLKPSQIRKDLSFLGEMGKRGVGYGVEELLSRVEDFLLDSKVHRLAIVGIGNLGSALATYRGLQGKDHRLVALFDSDPAKVGRRFGELEVLPVEKLEEVVSRLGVDVLIVCTPAEAVESLVARARSCGVKGILCFAPTDLVAPPGMAMQRVDVSSELRKLLFAMRELEGL